MNDLIWVDGLDTYTGSVVPKGDGAIGPFILLEHLDYIGESKTSYTPNELQKSLYDLSKDLDSMRRALIAYHEQELDLKAERDCYKTALIDFMGSSHEAIAQKALDTWRNKE